MVSHDRSKSEASDDPLSKWVHWVDQAIKTAQERGDFDDLPGHGKPLAIDEHPYAGDWALGFHVLNNAGIKPIWMELNGEIQRLLTRMQRLLDEMEREPPVVAAETSPQQPHRKRGWLARLASREATPAADTRPDQHQARTRARHEYLRLAAELDEQVRLYNQALPPGLRHLERPRFSEQDAARRLDAP